MNHTPRSVPSFHVFGPICTAQHPSPASFPFFPRCPKENVKHRKGRSRGVTCEDAGRKDTEMPTPRARRPARRVGRYGLISKCLPRFELASLIGETGDFSFSVVLLQLSLHDIYSYSTSIPPSRQPTTPTPASRCSIPIPIPLLHIPIPMHPLSAQHPGSSPIHGARSVQPTHLTILWLAPPTSPAEAQTPVIGDLRIERVALSVAEYGI
jgi:hypothetical protein